MEARLLDLVARDREHRLRDQEARLCKNARTEQARKIPGIRRALQLGRDDLDAAAIHLARIEQRKQRLLLQRVGTAVPEQPALRHEVLFGAATLRRALFGARGP